MSGLVPTSSAIFDTAAALTRDLVIAEPGDLAEELDIAQDADGTGFVWPITLDRVEYGVALLMAFWAVACAGYINTGHKISPTVAVNVTAINAVMGILIMSYKRRQSD